MSRVASTRSRSTLPFRTSPLLHLICHCSGEVKDVTPRWERQPLFYNAGSQAEGNAACFELQKQLVLLLYNKTCCAASMEGGAFQ